MTILNAGEHRTITLQIGQTLTIASAAGSAGMVNRRAVPEGGEPFAPVQLSGVVQTFGPYSDVAILRVNCTVGPLAFTVDGTGTVYARLAAGTVPTLAAGTITQPTTATAPGTAITTITGAPAGSKVMIEPDDGGLALASDGVTIVRGLKAKNVGSYNYMISAGIANPLMFALNIGDVQLSDVTLSTNAVNVGGYNVIKINGVPPGATLTGTMPTGATLRSASRTIVMPVGVLGNWSITQTYNGQTKTTNGSFTAAGTSTFFDASIFFSDPMFTRAGA